MKDRIEQFDAPRAHAEADQSSGTSPTISRPLALYMTAFVVAEIIAGVIA